jgi:hypothetical protein
MSSSRDLDGHSAAQALRSWRGARWREYGIRLVLELLVVFIGMYAASALAEYQKAKELEARRRQIRGALVEEIEAIAGDARSMARELNGMLTLSKAAADPKSYTPLQPFLNPVSPRVDMWEATLRSGGLDVLDVHTFWRVSQFYNRVNQGLAQFAQLRDLSEQMLLPVEGAGYEEYYDPKTGRIRPKYAWYYRGVGNLVRLGNQLAALGDSLVTELRPPQGRAAAGTLPNRSP